MFRGRQLFRLRRRANLVGGGLRSRTRYFDADYAGSVARNFTKSALQSDRQRPGYLVEKRNVNGRLVSRKGVAAGCVHGASARRVRRSLLCANFSTHCGFRHMHILRCWWPPRSTLPQYPTWFVLHRDLSHHVRCYAAVSLVFR